MHLVTGSTVTTPQPDLPVDKLYGDLMTPPPRDRDLFIADLHALSWMIHQPSTKPEMVSAMESVIEDRKNMLRAELVASPIVLNSLIRDRIHHQLRARPDFQTGQLAVEQWVPALGYWLVCGFFPPDVEYGEVIKQLKVGDPRFKTPTQRLEETRQEAADNRARLDVAHSNRITGTIDNMSSTQLSRFIEVERAIKSGDTLISHGEDLQFVESALDKTKRAAGEGDAQAQSVLTGGVRDSSMCVNPGHNPIVR